MSFYGSFEMLNEAKREQLAEAISWLVGYDISSRSLMVETVLPLTAEEIKRITDRAEVNDFIYTYQADYAEDEFGQIVVNGGEVVRIVSYMPEEYWNEIKNTPKMMECMSNISSMEFDTDEDLRDYLEEYLGNEYEFLWGVSDYIYYDVLNL